MTTIVTSPALSYKEYYEELKNIQMIEGIIKTKIRSKKRVITKYSFTEVTA